MSLIDKIEELGAAVDAGTLDQPTAVHQLVQYSDGGLTHLGAAESLANWQTRRAQYADIFMDAEMGLSACEVQLRHRPGGNLMTPVEVMAFTLQKLNDLGATEDQVAATLAAQGCRGLRGDCDRCPIAVYLTKHLGPGMFVTVDVAYVVVSTNVSGLGTVDLPTPVREFIANFDGGDGHGQLAGVA